MEEAEVLADNIVVIHQGELLEAGTTSQLKRKYGKDLHMHVGVHGSQKITPREVLNRIGCKDLRLDMRVSSDMNMIDKRIQEDTILKLLLPSDTTDVANVLTKIEDLIEKDFIQSMGLLAVSLEDVFCNMDKKARCDKDEQIASQLPTLQFKRDENATLRRIFALVSRHATSFWRSSLPLPYMEILIALTIALGAYMTNLNFGSTETKAPLLVNLDPLHVLTNQNMQIGYDVTTSSTSSSTILYHLKQDSDPKFVESMGPCLAAFLLHVDDSNACWIPSSSSNNTAPDVDSTGMSIEGNYVGAYRFEEFNSSSADYEYTVLPNASTTLSLPSLMTLVHNALGENLTSQKNLLRPSFKHMPEAEEEQDHKDQLDMIYAQIKSVMIMMLMMGFSYLFATRARASVESRANSHYQLQILQGVSFTEYWISQILWDVIYSYIIMIPAILAIFIFETPLAHGTTIILFFIWPFAILPMVYVVAYMFVEPEACFNMFSVRFDSRFDSFSVSLSLSHTHIHTHTHRECGR